MSHSIVAAVKRFPAAFSKKYNTMNLLEEMSNVNFCEGVSIMVRKFS